MKLKKIIIIIILSLTAILPFTYREIYFSIRYRYDENYSFKIPKSNHTIKVYRDLWYFGFAPGGGSDVPCIVKLVNNKTGRCLYSMKLDMIQLVNSHVISRRTIIWIGSGTEWKF